MSLINFKALVKKVNLKPKGVKEIVLEITDSALDGQMERLSGMIDTKVDVELEAQIINYSIKVETRTSRPVVEYQVDETGIVKPIEKTHEQLEADLGLPAEKIKTEDKQEQLDVDIFNSFMLEGFGPQYEDLPYNFEDIVKKRLDGDTFNKIGKEYGLNSIEMLQVLTDYQKRVAPLAQKWWEWKEEQGEAKVVKAENEAPESSEEVPEKEDPETAETSDSQFDEIEDFGDDDEEEAS
jgi:hypothetical protein